MKRTIFIFSLIISLLLTGCSIGGKPETSPAPAPVATPQATPAPMSESEQRAMIESLRHVWAMDSDIYSQWFYTITDMDHNGRLEVICATLQGTGLFTYADYYEISGDFAGLKQLELGIEDTDNWPDIIIQDADCYYDAANDLYYYVYENVTRNGAAECYYSIDAVGLADGFVSLEYLAGKSEIYPDLDSSPVISFSDADNKPISEEEYKSAADRRFAGLEKNTVSFEWTEVNAYDEDVAAAPAASKSTPEAYNAVIQKYTDIHNSQITDMATLIQNEVSIMIPYSSGLGYAPIDMDQNGVEELMIAGIGTDDFSANMVYELYTLVNGQLVKLCESQERLRWYWLGGDMLWLEGSSGAASQVYELYTVQNGQLIFCEGFSTTNSMDSSGSTVYHTTSRLYTELSSICGDYDAYDAAAARDQAQPYIDSFASQQQLPQMTAIY